MATYANERRGPTFVLPAGGNIIAGVWLFISAWVLGFSSNGDALWDGIVSGIVVVVIALVRMGGGPATRWLGWVNALVGAWVFVSPWVLGFSGNGTALWNDLILGVIVVLLGLTSANTGA